jgi:hypothetical protein
MALYSGSMSDYVNPATQVVGATTMKSMAEAMDKALDKLMTDAKKPALKQDQEATDRRMLFIAIAQGVIGHLKQEQSSLTVSVNSSSHTGHVTVNGS